MKQITILFLCLLLLCACVPTPETDAVRQKNTNVLIDTVRSADESPQPVRFEHFRYDATASRGNVHISADVPIEVLSETGTFPVVRVEHRFLSDAERLTLAKRLLGSDSLYLWEQHETRASLRQLLNGRDRFLDACRALECSRSAVHRLVHVHPAENGLALIVKFIQCADAEFHFKSSGKCPGRPLHLGSPAGTS